MVLRLLNCLECNDLNLLGGVEKLSGKRVIPLVLFSEDRYDFGVFDGLVASCANHE